MKRYFSGIFILLFPLGVLAQLFPLSDQYRLNPLVINPAFAGCHNATSVTVQYRDQWTGFKDGPENLLFSAHAPVNLDRTGLGLLINRNTLGIYNKTELYGNYAYRHEVYNGKLALGLGFGFALYNIGWDGLNAVDDDDALLPGNSESAFLPDFSVGAYYYTKKYFIGVSLPGFLSHFNDAGSGKYRVKNDFSAYNFFFTGGYEFDVSPVMTLLPTLLVKVQPNHATQVDCNLDLCLKERIWLGLGYRTGEMLMGSLQCQVNDQLRLAYSFDYHVGSLGNYQKGSHEILLGYLFSYKRSVPNPRQF
jgi:type IX secretion system PorP/SprF family membrane protein